MVLFQKNDRVNGYPLYLQIFKHLILDLQDVAPSTKLFPVRLVDIEQNEEFIFLFSLTKKQYFIFSVKFFDRNLLTAY